MGWSCNVCRSSRLSLVLKNKNCLFVEVCTTQTIKRHQEFRINTGSKISPSWLHSKRKYSSSGTDSSCLKQTLHENWFFYLLIKRPLEECVAVPSHHHKKQRQVGATARPITVQVDSQAHLVAIFTGIKCWKHNIILDHHDEYFNQTDVI